MGFDMHGKTAGIIGTGKIAKILIHILKGFGMNILAYDLYPDYNFAREEQIVYTSLDELYHSSDIISLHCPLTEATKYLINDYSISKMKDGVMMPDWMCTRKKANISTKTSPTASSTTTCLPVCSHLTM